MPRVDREAVACASGMNWCSFILLLFATISSYWTWGWALSPNGLQVSASLGPWVAGQIWSTFGVPCGCNIYGWCTGICYASTQPVEWLYISPAQACGPQSQIYVKWSGPLGYCKFPEGFVVPEPNYTNPDNNTNDNWMGEYGFVPDGTLFVYDYKISVVQALMIISTITVFFASVIGCADAGSEPGQRKKAVSSCAAFCSLIGWVFCLAAYCLWTTIEYIQRLQSVPPTIGVPVWTEYNALYAATPVNMWLGAGWGTSLTASILTFFACIVHCGATSGGDNDDGAFTPAKQEQQPQQQSEANPPTLPERPSVPGTTNTNNIANV